MAAADPLDGLRHAGQFGGIAQTGKLGVEKLTRFAGIVDATA